MPIVKPKQGEQKQHFIVRFMDNEKMKAEFPDNEQRAAIAYSQWKTKDKAR